MRRRLDGAARRAKAAARPAPERGNASALVGVDVGTTGVKAVAISPDGEVVARAEEEYALSTPRPGWSEQEPDDWVRATETALSSLASVTGSDPVVGLSGQMHGLVVLGADGAPLRPAIL